MYILCQICKNHQDTFEILSSRQQKTMSSPKNRYCASAEIELKSNPSPLEVLVCKLRCVKCSLHLLVEENLAAAAFQKERDFRQKIQICSIMGDCAVCWNVTFLQKGESDLGNCWG